jgi:polar amino acid transport system ATP-binding protein
MWSVFTLRMVRGVRRPAVRRQPGDPRPLGEYLLSMPPSTAIEFSGVQKWFGSNHVLADIDLAVATGEVVVVIGPSGSGKSTFLRCINHLEKIDAGRLSVDGELVGYTERGDRIYELPDREVCKKRSEIGMVFQRFNLFPHMTALENVIEAPLRVKGENREQAFARAGALLDRVGLADKVKAYPNQLSGGQQQRVAIARALVTAPEVVFADEPTGALDTRNGREVLALLREVVDRDGHTVVMVTHDPVAAAHADRVILLADGRLAGTLDAPSADEVAEQLAHLGE